MTQILQHPKILKFSKTLRLALFWKGFLDALLLVSFSVGALILVLWLFGIPTHRYLRWYDCFLLLLPISFGLFQAFRFRFSLQDCAAYVDRRLNLQGLLLTSLEQGTSDWEPLLSQKMAEHQNQLLHYRFKKLVPQLVLSALFIGGIFLLPAPPSLFSGASPLIQKSLQDLKKEIEDLRQAGVLTEKERVDLKKQVEDLEKQAEQGESVSWPDLDRVSDQIAQNQAEKLRSLQKAQAALSQFAQSGNAKSPEAKKELAELINQAEQLSQDRATLQKKPPHENRSGENDPGKTAENQKTEKLDPSQIPDDEEQVRQLAKKSLQKVNQTFSKLKERGLNQLEQPKPQFLPDSSSENQAGQLESLQKAQAALSQFAQSGNAKSPEAKKELAELINQAEQLPQDQKNIKQSSNEDSASGKSSTEKGIGQKMAPSEIPDDEEQVRQLAKKSLQKVNQTLSQSQKRSLEQLERSKPKSPSDSSQPLDSSEKPETDSSYAEEENPDKSVDQKKEQTDSQKAASQAKSGAKGEAAQAEKKHSQADQKPEQSGQSKPAQNASSAEEKNSILMKNQEMDGNQKGQKSSSSSGKPNSKPSSGQESSSSSGKKDSKPSDGKNSQSAKGQESPSVEKQGSKGESGNKSQSGSKSSSSPQNLASGQQSSSQSGFSAGPGEGDHTKYKVDPIHTIPLRTEKLPPGDFASQDLGEVIGIGAAAPSEGPVRAHGGGRPGSEGNAQSGPSRAVPPSYRPVIKRFFSNTK